MRHAVTWCVFFLLLPITLFAETRYVSEIREITLRTGPGTEFKITAMIKSGTPMTVLAEEEKWTQVETSDGKEGWVLNQFLQAKIPDSIELEKLQTQYASLGRNTEVLKNENKSLTEKVDQLTADLARRTNEFDTLNTAHETLVDESGEFLTLQSDYEKIVEELAEQKQKADRMENELASIYNDKRLKWFMIGAGVLLLGIIIGFITKPQRRRSSLL